MVAKSQNRDVLARELKGEKSREIYFGKPGLFNYTQIWADLKIRVYLEDVVTAFPEPSFGIGSKITILRATPVIVADAGEKTLYRTQKETVLELLKEKNILVYEKDILSTGLDSFLVPEMQITITRVAELEVTQKSEISFKTVKKEDSNLEKGKIVVKEKGQTGLKELTFKIRRENGKEVSRQLLAEKIINQPKDEIVVYGMKIITLGQGLATWYTRSLSMVAAHNSLPKGTRVRVVNLSNGKSVVVTIVGGGIYRSGVIIDLSYDAFAALANPGSGIISVRLEKE